MNDMIQIDLQVEGVIQSDTSMSEQQMNEHAKKIKRFFSDEDKGAFIYEDENSIEIIGLLMYSVVNRDATYPWATIYHEIDRNLFQQDGRFIAIFQLWVAPAYRRCGIASKLKQKLEELAQIIDVNVIYTHTEEKNQHVIELNKKLGYEVVRKGPIWDEVVRVSLIKHLQE